MSKSIQPILSMCVGTYRRKRPIMQNSILKGIPLYVCS